MFQVFLGDDSRMKNVAQVARYSIQKNASAPVNIRFLTLSSLRQVHGFDPLPDDKATTEFMRSRFLVPWLMGYEGVALFADNDIVCLGDVQELAKLDMANYAIRCVKHDHQPDATIKMDNQVQTSYPRKNWSSVMLLNCAKLKHWTKAVVENVHPRYLHRFMDVVPDELIGELDPKWNQLDCLTVNDGLLHLTSGGPWYRETENCPGAELWRQYCREYEETCK